MKRKVSFLVSIVGIFLISCQQNPANISLKNECISTLNVLTDALLDLQITDKENPDFGALQCPGCHVLHTRAAEAVYPFAVRYKLTKDKKYVSAAIHLGNWLIKQQLSEGQWKETPEEWTGTTTDQLLMMVLAYPILKKDLSADERDTWRASMRKAADYLTRVMSPDFASINYCATTTATLAMTNALLPDNRYLEKANVLARQVLAKMDDDGFIAAEGDRVYGVKYGADVGYEIDMSLWGLALYARTVGDTLVDRYVRQSLKNHLYFVYPNGAIDGSWGIRSNKWTTFGSETADGCQILFSLFSEQDSRYRTAAIKNLHYLNSMIKGGLIGYGPQYWDLFEELPCIYPTFVRSKNLAMAIELGDSEAGDLPPLPSEESGWVKFYPTVDVALVRSENFMATISAYGYKELRKKYKSKYMHRPTGGSICNLWVEGYGFLQVSSQTAYHRWEPMHFPEVGEVRPLTSRIEFENENGYFTNLYEFDARLTVQKGNKNEVARICTSGELCNREFYPGGVAFSWEYRFFDAAIEKTVNLRYHDGQRNVKIVEPFVMHHGMFFQKIDPRTIHFECQGKKFELRVIEGNARIILGQDADKYWAAFPSIKAYPITLEVQKSKEEFREKLTYRISILDSL